MKHIVYTTFEIMPPYYDDQLYCVWDYWKKNSPLVSHDSEPKFATWFHYNVWSNLT